MLKDVDFEAVLNRTCGKTDVQAVANIVCQHPELINEVWMVAKSATQYAWRAVWALSHINEKNSALLEPYLPEITRMMVGATNLSLKRELLKILLQHPLPDDPSGELLDCSLALITSKLVPVGLRMYAMEMVAAYCDRYPDLKNEFVAILEDIMAEPPSVGMKGRASRLIQRLS